MASIKLNTGIKTYDIEDEHGNIRGQISIATDDLNFTARALRTQENISKLIGDIGAVSEDISREEEINYITEIDKKIKEEINILFDNNNVSEVVFGNQNCLNTLNGITFVERFLNAIIPIIKKDIEKEQKASADRIHKYTSMVK